MADLSRFRAALLDIDGTLVDSNDAHARAWEQALVETGHQVPLVAIRRLIGMGGDKLLPMVAGIDIDSPIGKRIAARRGEIFLSYIPRLRPTRGVRRLLSRFRDRDVTMVVATSAEGHEVKRLLDVAGAAEFIDGASSADDVERSKPDPDIIHAALRRAGVPADAAIIIGDTPYDIEAANRAGVPMIALRSGGWWSDADLAGAIAIYDDPESLAAQLADVLSETH